MKTLCLKRAKYLCQGGTMWTEVSSRGFLFQPSIFYHYSYEGLLVLLGYKIKLLLVSSNIITLTTHSLTPLPSKTIVKLFTTGIIWALVSMTFLIPYVLKYIKYQVVFGRTSLACMPTFFCGYQPCWIPWVWVVLVLNGIVGKQGVS